MRAYEIEGWLTGTKIRRKSWGRPTDHYFFSPDRKWHNVTYRIDHDKDFLAHLFIADDWEPYTEPPRKRKVTQYRDTILCGDGSFYTGSWSSNKNSGLEIVHTETREIEVEGKP